MMIFENFEPKKTQKLIGYHRKFNFLKNLLEKQKFPKVLLLSGEKGIGKFTLISHLMHFYFDKANYDLDNYTINQKSIFNKQFIQNLFPNILYLQGSNLQNLKIDDIRILKNKLQKTSIDKDKRFIIFDDVEIFNLSSMNGLLKLIEEPSSNNYFILINNKSKPLIKTIASRCMEIKIILDNKIKNEILSYLVKFFNQKMILNKDIINISPGNLVKFNYFFDYKKINPDEKFLVNLNILLNLYKKEKDVIYKNLIFFFIDYYLKKNKYKMINKNKNLFEKRSELIKIIDKFFLYNLNQNNLLTFLENNYFNE